MHPFRYARVRSVDEALAAIAGPNDIAFAGQPMVALLAGGTSQIDLMKEDVHRPAILVDVTRLPFGKIEKLPGGGLRIGAGVKNTTAAFDPDVQKHYPGLAESILAGASVQIRNMASMGGNLLQRTRCPYFRDTTQACNKREPGTGCAALHGINRIHAVLGASPQCVATHPSDMCVMLAALDAVVQVRGPKGSRAIAFVDFHRLPGDTPQRDTNLEPNEIITSLDLPAFTGHSHYYKVRERASYAFALVSVGAALDMDGSTIKTARVALGSVAHKPWRATEAEQMLAGKPASEALFRQAADAAFAGAKPLEHNAYKIPLGKATFVRCLMETSGLSPLQAPAGTAHASSAGGVAGEMPNS